MTPIPKKKKKELALQIIDEAILEKVVALTRVNSNEDIETIMHPVKITMLSGSLVDFTSGSFL